MFTQQLELDFRSEDRSSVGPSNPQDTVIAWDIETCPLPSEKLSDTQSAYVERNAEYFQEEDGLSLEKASQKAASLAPFAGRICSIAAVRGGHDDGFAAPKVYVAETESEEAEILQAFWEDVSFFGDGVTWVTFGGKGFDVPFLAGRSLSYNITPTRSDILKQYPFGHRPHTDLKFLWPKMHYRLQDLCGVLGVPTPKSSMDGSMVPKAIQEGRFDEVAAYNADDALATLSCYQKVPSVVTDS
jgi:predicted PolB exonuclease-like 3'-5' exonuclease